MLYHLNYSSLQNQVAKLMSQEPTQTHRFNIFSYSDQFSKLFIYLFFLPWIGKSILLNGTKQAKWE